MSIVVWSKDACPQCDQAKNILKQRGMTFEERKIGQGWTREQLLAAAPTARSVPQIFSSDDLIGGVTDLIQYLNKN